MYVSQDKKLISTDTDHCFSDTIKKIEIKL